MDYIEECIEKFNKLPQELQDYLNSEKVLKTLDDIEGEYNMDLTLALVLIFINEMELGDLSVYIEEKYKTSNETTNRVLIKIEEEIFSPIIDSFSGEEEESVFSEKDYLLDLSLEEKRNLVLEVFSKKILGQFKISEEHLLRLNAITFEVIGKDEPFFDKILKAFFDNEEKISSQEITLKEKKVSPSISNWIKDFISENNSDMFSVIDMAKYLSKSPNVNKLNQEEKQLLRQILKIYRNLAFFPESMGNAKYEDWEIFPINRDLLSLYNKKSSPSVPEDKKDNLKKEGVEEVKEVKKDIVVEEKKVVEEKPDELRELLKQYSAGSLERRAVEAEIKRQSKGDLDLKNKDEAELRFLLEKYPAGTLEHKAIKVEIKNKNKS